MGGKRLQEILCLRSWQDSGIVTLDGNLFEQAVRQADSAPIDERLAYTKNNINDSDDELYTPYIDVDSDGE